MSSLSHSSYHHLFAEIASAPVSSEASFFQAITHLNRSSRGTAEIELWRRTESEMAAKFSEKMLDELIAIRDRTWYPKTESGCKRSITSHVRHLSQVLLASHGFFAMPSVGGASVDEARSELAGHNHHRFGREGWFWLTRSMPSNLLLCAQNLGTEVKHLMPALENMLREKRYAQIHVHLGAAMSFRRLWSCIPNVLSYSGFEYDAFKSPNSVLQDGQHLAIWLLKALVIRQLLARFIFTASGLTSLKCFLDLNLGVKRQERAQHQSDGSTNFAQSPGESRELYCRFPSLLEEVIESMTNPGSATIFDQPKFNEIQSLYRSLIPTPRSQPSNIQALLETDPIAPLSSENATSYRDYEDIWIRRSFDYLTKQERNGQPDELYELFFWQVQRVRGLFFRHITQQKQSPGLVWFTRYYRRISPSRKGVLSTGAMLHAAAESAGLNHGLMSLEVRIAPEKTAVDLLEEVRRIAQAALEIQPDGYSHRNGEKALKLGGLSKSRGSQSARCHIRGENALAVCAKNQLEMKPEVGIVFHFVKERDRGSQEFISPYGSNSHENPDWGSLFYRFAPYFRKTNLCANAIVQVLDNFPLSLQWIRGVDVCNQELSMPTWVFVPLYQKVFDASKRASAFLRESLELEVPAIRKTAHVGEDFIHLLTGLRRIDEALEFLRLREGDRLGHALALGVDPVEWAKKSGPVAIDKTTRLFDLAWEWSVLDSISNVSLGNRVHFVEAKLLQLISELFSHWNETGIFEGPAIESVDGSSIQKRGDFKIGRSPTIHEIVNLRQDLANTQKLIEVGFPDGKPTRIFHQCSTRRLRILLGYLADRRLFEKGKEILLVDPFESGETLRTLQDGLRRKVGSRGVVVEVNPTSNLLISRFGDLKDHPLWRLDSPNYTDSIPPVSLAIGSDDPLIFATDLRQEYQRLTDAMLAAGYSDREAKRWIDEVRNNGIESRFTLPNIMQMDIKAIKRSR